MGNCDLKLTKYWIKVPGKHWPFGLGVTAHSIEDALNIMRAIGYAEYLPDDLKLLEITEGISSIEQIPQRLFGLVGPIAVRGVWYPFRDVGLPKWAQEKIDNLDLSQKNNL